MVVSDLLINNLKTMDELVESCINYYNNTVELMDVDNLRESRANLACYVERFHNESGTLTSTVKKSLETLINEDCLVVMSAHQPNLFAYNGVMRKFTLISVLADELEKRLGLPVITFFGLADQDFSDDRWVKSTLLPAVERKDGIFSLHIKLPDNLVLNNISKPPKTLVNDWKVDIGKWLDETTNSVEKLSKLCDMSFVKKSTLDLKENFDSFWELVFESYELSKSYSDFNSFIMSKIVNEVWGYDTLFARFSDCQKSFVNEINFLLSNFPTYSKFLTEAHDFLSSNGLSSGVSSEECQVIPFWYHCDCGSKVRLTATLSNGFLYGKGKCQNCETYYNLDLGAIEKPDASKYCSRFSLRAIPWILLFSKGLGFSCYVGGAGGISYLTEVKFVANRMGFPLPPIPIWRPRDRYVGIAQLQSLLKLQSICNDLKTCDLFSAQECLKSRISRTQNCLDILESFKKKLVEELSKTPEGNVIRDKIKKASITQTKIKRSSGLSVDSYNMKILENFKASLSLFPSIIDYAINVGLKETSDQWRQHLIENGDLTSDVDLKSLLVKNDKNLAQFQNYPLKIIDCL